MTGALSIGAATDVGTVRELNEDNHGFVRCGCGDFLVVCDGMGGHAAGDVASRLATDALLQAAVQARPDADPVGMVNAAIHAAQAAVAGAAAKDTTMHKMGTMCHS